MSTQIIDTNVLDNLLASQGIKLPKRPCCGRSNSTPIKYANYLKRLGYTGRVAVQHKGVITEICDIK